MPEERRELPKAEAAVWERRFREADRFTEVIAAVNEDTERLFEIRIEDLYCSSVSRYDGSIRVLLGQEESRNGFTTVLGRFDPTDASLDTVSVEQGHVAAPLAGNGFTWELQDGEIRRSRWIS